jgi:hypothetical protein
MEDENNSYFFNNAINLFSECLDMTTQEPDIPDEIYNKIENYFSDKENLDSINVIDVKNVMKTLKLNKYYEYINFIWIKLTNKMYLMPTINENNKKKLIDYFKVIYNINKDKFPGTSNIPIHFILSKIILLVDVSDITRNFFEYKLNSKEKLEYYNKKWQEIEPEFLNSI